MSAYPSQLAYSKSRRDWARANGHCQQCHKQPARIVDGAVKSQCRGCYEAQCRRVGREPSQQQPSLVAYQPLEEILERPDVRVLRALCWFDGVSTSDLLDSMDIDDSEDRVMFDMIIRQHRIRKRIGGAGLHHITPAGRSWLAKQLARADVGVATEEEAA